MLLWLAELDSNGCITLLTVSSLPTMASVARMDPHGWWGSDMTVSMRMI